MVQSPTKKIFRPKQETEVFDELDALLPVPFASELQLTLRDLLE